MSETEPVRLLLWLDVETTGLDPERCQILELACCVTTLDLQELGRKSWLIPLENNQYVNGFVVKMHQKSGLLDDLAATGEVRVLDVIGSLTSFLNEMVVAGARIGRGFDPSVDRPFHPAGFSVHTDINHLKRWGCRSVLQMLHHRHADVSALKLFYRAWVGEVPERREEPEHRAMPDVEESIEMAKWFRDVFQRGAPRPNPKNIEDIRFPAVLFRALKEFDEKENSQDLKNLSTPSTL